jgi:vancomycin resistance protein YoaR
MPIVRHTRCTSELVIESRSRASQGGNVRRYLIAAAISIPLILVVGLVAVYAYEEVVAEDTVSRGVSAVGIDLSGMTAEEATEAISEYEETLASEELEVVVDGHPRIIDPRDVGFTIDEEAVVDEAMHTSRSSSGFTNFGLWIGNWSDTVEILVPTTLDEDAVTALLSGWNVTAIDKPAYEGAVTVVNGRPAPEYPLAGVRIDEEPSMGLILEAMSGHAPGFVVIPLKPLVPVVTDADVDEAVRTANRLVSQPVTLRPPGRTTALVFSSAGLTSALRSEVVVNSPAAVVPSLDPEILRSIAAASAPEFDEPPVSASFAFNGTTKQISVVPSRIGRTVDLDSVPEAVIIAANGWRGGNLPMMEGEQPELTTEAAEAMGPFGEVSTFTTRHPCCQSRVVNIQLLADTIGGNWLMPGDEFSINDTAGKRTTAKGYTRAGAIIGGEVTCCDSPINIGGGTSQFATTFYNAIFFGCYEDIFHQPHSLYFSRYPFVREATLGFPAPDVKFRNDSAAPVYIETSHTSGSITVTLHGNNGGRECESVRSGNTITRVMTHPDGSVTKQAWTWNYRQPKPKTPPPTTTTSTTSTSTTTTTTEAPPPTVAP